MRQVRVREKKGHEVEEEEDGQHEARHKEESPRDFCMRTNSYSRVSQRKTKSQ